MLDQQEQHNHGNTQFWIGLFLGGLLGAVMIVLMGTEKGRKLAKKLQEEGLDLWDETKDKIDEKSGELMEKGKELVEQGKVIEQQVVEKAEEVKEKVVEQTAQTAYSTLSHIEALQERGRKATSDLKKQLFKNIPRKTIS